MTLASIACLLEIDERFLSTLIAVYPAEVPATTEDLEQWEAFVSRHRD